MILVGQDNSAGLNKKLPSQAGRSNGGRLGEIDAETAPMHLELFLLDSFQRQPSGSRRSSIWVVAESGFSGSVTMAVMTVSVLSM